jgi:hypothetical protein
MFVGIMGMTKALTLNARPMRDTGHTGTRRETMRRKILTFAALVAAASALAQERPMMLPVRDVAVEYHSRGMVPGPAGELTSTVMVRFASNRQELRVDGPYGRFYALVDINAALMMIVMPEQRLYVEQPADPGIIALLQGAPLWRIGAETVAGIPCTAYDATLNQHSGRVCLTDDGVLLRAQIAEPDRRPELEAVNVTYGPQPARMFTIPAGFQKLNMPNLPFGLNFGPLGGGAHGGYPGDQFGR